MNDLINKLNVYRMVKKTGHVWALITLWWLPIERRVICQTFQNDVEKKGWTCIAKHLNIFFCHCKVINTQTGLVFWTILYTCIFVQHLWLVVRSYHWRFHSHGSMCLAVTMIRASSSKIKWQVGPPAGFSTVGPNAQGSDCSQLNI